MPVLLFAPRPVFGHTFVSLLRVLVPSLGSSPRDRLEGDDDCDDADANDEDVDDDDDDESHDDGTSGDDCMMAGIMTLYWAMGIMMMTLMMATAMRS